MAAAKATVAKYTAHPTAFPVEIPLAKKLPASAKLGYLQCAAPICALLGQIVQGGGKLMGNAVTPVKADNSSDSIQSSLSSILAAKPAGLLLPAVNLGALGDSLSKFSAANIPVVGMGVQGGKAQGVDAPLNGPPNIKLVGSILADWAIANGAPDGEVVFYNVPELDFSVGETSAFKAELAKNCPSCKLRVTPLSVTTIGTTAPSRVVSDLQASPNTKVAIFASMEAATGVPAALKTAGITINTNGFAPTPANLQDIKTGGLTGGLGLDVGVMGFTAIDAAVRLATNQPLTPNEKAGFMPLQLLTKATVPADPSKGWSAYPDFPARFAKLWATTKTG